jgi:predicted dehydrogenase
LREREACMKKTLHWGLLSTARINKALVPPLQISQRNKLLAVASRSQEKADIYAHEKKIKRSYGSYEAILALLESAKAGKPVRL